MLGLRFSIWLLLATAMVFSGIEAFAKPPFLESQTTTEWRFVGITDTSYEPGTTSGFQGGLGIMNGLCAEEVTTNSRMCSSAEVQRSTNIYGLEAGAWLMPSERVVVWDPEPPGSWLAYDSASGVSNLLPRSRLAAGDLSCGPNYNDGSTYLGLTLNESGQIQSVPCNGNSQRVACCAPVAIPVNPLE